jgi:aspartyl-tRNA(Asn)/glutamyl-tRNA(Gln) amidotransferase subunit B
MSTLSIENLTHTDFEPVIGLEVHVQLNTHTKLFCGCPTQFGAEPNHNTCPICLGMPGVLPVLNRQAVDYAIMLGLALNLNIAHWTKFDRKQYFYPDLPKGYQISQFDQPITHDGWMLVAGRKIGIERAHLEEDAGKLVHQGAAGLSGSTHSLVDLNRAGTPLLEVVSKPDIRSSEEARLYAETLRQIVRYLGVGDGNLEEGSMRVDVNISVRPKGQEKFGTKAELKNMNSFRAIQRATDYEIARQIDVILDGGQIKQETRLWDEAAGKTVSSRSKEDAHDYRYFPEPDLRPLVIDEAWIDSIRKAMPELPAERLERYQRDFQLSEYDASVLVEFKDLGDFFDATAALNKHTNSYKTIANLLMGDVTGLLKKNNNQTLAESKLTPDGLAELVGLIEANTISSAIAKKMLPDLLEKGGSPQTMVEEQGLAQITDDGAIRDVIRQVLAENTETVNDYKSGKDKVFGFLVGQCMKASKGKANPDQVNQLLKELLSE